MDFARMEERRLSALTRGETIISPGPWGVGGRLEYRERSPAERLLLVLVGGVAVRFGVLLAACRHRAIVQLDRNIHHTTKSVPELELIFKTKFELK